MRSRQSEGCAVDGCLRPYFAQTYCRLHYVRWRTHGDPLVLKNGRGLSLMDRFMARTERQPNGCLLWTAGTNDGGYGRFAVAHDQNVAPHRWIYEQKVGPIPAGLTIDHVKDRGCISRLCVEWTHLEAVTLKENLLRGDTFAARNAAKTECPRGHPYDSIGAKGERGCRRCAAERQRRYQARKAAGLVGK